MTEISGVVQSTDNEKDPDAEWLRSNGFELDEKGKSPYSPEQFEQIQIIVNQEWVPLSHILRFDRIQLKSIIGEDGIFARLHEVTGAMAKPYRDIAITLSAAASILERGYEPRELRRAFEDSMDDLLGIRRAGSAITREPIISPVTLVIIQGLKDGYDLAEIATQAWSDRSAPYRHVYGIEPLPVRSVRREECVPA